MIRRGWQVLSVILIVLVMSGDATSTQGQATPPIDTAFTYQGQLNRAGGPAEGQYDFRFTLHSDPEKDTQLSEPITQTIDVHQGLFQARLNFGDSLLGEGARYLQVEVRLQGDPSGQFSRLSPRQELTPAPYAITASSVSWDKLTNVPGPLKTFANLSCTDEQVAKWSNNSWVCASTQSPKIRAQVFGTNRVATPCTSFDPVITGCSTEWFDIPDMSITVTTGNSPLLVLFKAGGIQPSIPYPPENTVLLYRLLIDGVERANARHEFDNEGGGGWQIRDVSLNWLEILPAGAHTIQVQYKSQFAPLDGTPPPATTTFQNNVSWGETTRNLIVIEL